MKLITPAVVAALLSPFASAADVTLSDWLVRGSHKALKDLTIPSPPTPLQAKASKPKQRHWLSLLQEAHAKVVELEDKVKGNSWETLGPDMKSTIDDVSAVLEENLAGAIRQDREDTQGVIDQRLENLRLKTRLAVEVKVDANIQDNDVIECRAEEQLLLKGSVKEFARLHRMRVDKDKKCSAMDQARWVAFSSVWKQPWVEDCDLLVNADCEMDIWEQANRARQMVREQRMDFMNKKAECEEAMRGVNKLLGGETLFSWVNGHFSMKKSECDRKERLAWAAACSFGDKLQEKCTEKNMLDEAVIQATERSGSVLSERDREQAWYVVQSARCLLSGFKQGALFSDSGMRECMEQIDYKRDVGPIDQRRDEIAALMTEEHYTCKETAIGFSGSRWTTGADAEDYVMNEFAPHVTISPLGDAPFEFCTPPIEVDGTNVSAVVVSLTVVGVDYDMLENAPMLRPGFETAIQEVMALHASVPVDHVTLSVSAGSVHVIATIAPPAGGTILAMGTSLAPALTSAIAALPGINDVSDGPISVTLDIITTQDNSNSTALVENPRIERP